MSSKHPCRTDCHARRPRRSAFSLVELASVVVLCSTIAALGVPRWVQHGEQRRVAEALDYLAHIHQMQQKHYEVHGCFEADPRNLDLAFVVPVDFSIELNTSTYEGEKPLLWSATLVRQGAWQSYGEYRLTFNESGFSRDLSMIDADLLPHRDTLTAR